MAQVQQLQHDLDQKSHKIGMLQQELQISEVRIDEYEDEIRLLKEALEKALTRKLSPRKPLRDSNGEADTLALLEDETINQSAEYEEDDITGTPFKLMGSKRLQVKLNSTLKSAENKENVQGFDSFMANCEEKDRQHEEINLLNEVNQELDIQNKELTSKVEELSTAFEEAMVQVDELKLVIEEKTIETAQQGRELESVQTDLIKATNQINDLAQVQKENENLCEQLESMELNYVDQKDQVKQGNNLFAEVEERRDYVEQIALRHKEEILRLRSEKSKVAQELNTRRQQVKKMQSIIETKKSIEVDQHPEYLALLENYRKCYKELDLKKDQLKVKNERIYDLTHRNGKFLDLISHNNYIEDNFKLEEKNNKLHDEIRDLQKERGNLQKDRDDFEYKYKMMEFYDKAFAEEQEERRARVFDSKASQVDVDELRGERSSEAEAGECKQQ